MKLIDLNPRWCGAGGEGVTNSATGEQVPERRGVAISFDCPCGCGDRYALFIDPPLDGLGPYVTDGQNEWQRTGDTFENLTLTPSILRSGGCQWHGFITNGEISTA